MIGDVATWELPPAEIDAAGIVHTHACDDLSAVAAALSAYDALLAGARSGLKVQDVRLLLTRSEEIGFTGAIAACKHRTMPKGSRVIALENSRSFADSPIGGGPIVRVGDRLSVFSPSLTAACGKRAEQLAGKAAAPTATQKSADFATGMKWQRKLMAGGACEATVYCAYGYEATCLCLPLGNYHNMAHLQEVQDGTYDRARLGPPRVAPEQNALADYFGLVDLLVGIGVDLPRVDPITERIEKLYDKHAFVLEEGRGDRGAGERFARRRTAVRRAKAPSGGKGGRAVRAGGKSSRGKRAAAKKR
jgi:endoglucanase